MNINTGKYKRGTLAVMITAGVLAALVLVNIVFTLISNRFHLYIDVTTERYNEISKKSKELLGEIDPAENNITIYFLADRDELDNPSLGYIGTGSTTDLWGMKYIYELALEYAASYSYINVELLSLKDDQERLTEYKSTVGVSLNKNTVIIDNYTGEIDEKGDLITDASGNSVMHHNYRLVSRDAFFRAESETRYAFAFDGDYRFTSVLLSLAGRNPTVYFLTGHGEKVGDPADAGDFGDAQALRDVFFDAGFVTRKVDLSTDYERVFADESARVLVVFGPDTDYKSADDDVNEMSLIHKFACRENHNLMFFIDETADKLTNLKEYMYDYCGVSFKDSVVRDVGTGGISDDGYAFISAYESDEYSIGLSLLESLYELDSQPGVAFKNASALSINDKYIQTPSTSSSGFYENASSTITGGMFLAPATAAAVNDAGETVVNYSESELDPVMTLTYETWNNSNNKTVSTYVLISGTTGFADPEYLNDPSYGNSDVMMLAMRLMGKETIPFEIDFKVISSEAVEMTESEVTAWTVLMCALVPVASLAAGTLVYFKRRHM